MCFHQGVEVIHEQVHHEIPGECFNMVVLKQETERAEFDRSESLVESMGGEAQIHVEAQAGFKIH